ncbi:MULTISPECIES: hypothetical protein [unclassified Aureispira]|uniref:hypothetical protein n=1 Tax=unclassified Aureispira TaxID=2649989 RepID=UPI000696E7A5|nr:MULTISPECIES: hypothetical protein [unclassified Aureispira]WMX13153.1 hypothetical protein QP953_20125 [Aureispira sp. CCB-E]
MKKAIIYIIAINLSQIIRFSPLILITGILNSCYIGEHSTERQRAIKINVKEAKGLVLKIEEYIPENDSLTFLDITFHNPTDSHRTAYWYNFNYAKNKIPLSLNISVKEKNGDYLWHKFTMSYYMDPGVYKMYKKYTEQIDIMPGSTFKRRVELNWIGKKKGEYEFTLHYFRDVLESNTINVSVKY